MAIAGNGSIANCDNSAPNAHSFHKLSTMPFFNGDTLLEITIQNRWRKCRYYRHCSQQPLSPKVIAIEANVALEGFQDHKIKTQIINVNQFSLIYLLFQYFVIKLGRYEGKMPRPCFYHGDMAYPVLQVWYYNGRVLIS